MPPIYGHLEVTLSYFFDLLFGLRHGSVLDLDVLVIDAELALTLSNLLSLEYQIIYDKY